MTRRRTIPVRWRCDDVVDDDDDARSAQATADTLNKLLQATLKSNEIQMQPQQAAHTARTPKAKRGAAKTGKAAKKGKAA